MLKSLRLLFIVLPFALASTSFAAAAKNCGCECCKGKEVCCCNVEDAAATTDPADTARHPLRGVIVAIHAEDSTLTVKHEAIPGVMRVMTMVFKVEPAALAVAKKGETITAQMSHVGDDWWLHEVTVAPKKS